MIFAASSRSSMSFGNLAIFGHCPYTCRPTTFDASTECTLFKSVGNEYPDFFEEFTGGAWIALQQKQVLAFGSLGTWWDWSW